MGYASKMKAKTAALPPVVEYVQDKARAWSPQQEAIFDWFGNGAGNLIVRARAGCLEAEAEIAIHRQGKGWTITLEELAAKFNGGPWQHKASRRWTRGWNLENPTFVQQEVNGVVRLVPIKAVWCSGKRMTHTVTTETGRKLRGSAKHPFLTSRGWVRLKNLKVGDFVHVRGNQTKGSSLSKTTYSGESGMWNHPFAIVRPPDKTHPTGTARVSTHRLVVEAHYSGMEYQEFLWRIRDGRTEGLVFYDPKLWAVHHRDRDTLHNTPSNLEVMSHEDHFRLHGNEDTMSNVLFKIVVEQIESVEQYGEETTYDIEVEGPQHNFLANGFVVHNTGKTTTIIEGVKRAPEPTILMAAFNKRIAEELSARIPSPNVEAKTLHSIGFMIVKEYWGGVRVARYPMDRETELSRTVCKGAPDTIIKLVGKLHTKAREINPLAKDGEALLSLAEQFECEPEAFWGHQGFGLQYVCESAYTCMQVAAETRPTTGIDFADMIYLPLKKNWAIGKFDMVVVDEAQDMTIAQLDLARKVLVKGGRMCVVGDDRQAIYGFRGADSSSIDRLKTELSAKELGLNVTYRCGKSIVGVAQRLVGDIEAHESNGQGIVSQIDSCALIGAAQPGDFILSRLNAPLAGVCMQLIREGKRAEIAGRDIAAGLKALMRKVGKVGKGAKSVDEFIANLQIWETREVTRLRILKFDTRVQLIQDQAETLEVLCEGADTVTEVEKRLDTIFSDEGPNTQRILCSSVHRAKGLEADRVFLLDWTFRDGGKGGQEELNIKYVAITRARHRLTTVSR